MILITCISEEDIPKIDSPMNNTALLQQALALYNIMTLEEKIGQLLIMRVETNAKTMSKKFQNIIETIQPGGLVFFQNNIDSTKQITQFITSVQKTSKTPLFISVDVEGGKINRFRSTSNPVLSNIPSARQMSETQTPEQVQAYAFTIGQALYSIGFNMNFAPIADILYPSTHPFLHERIFANDANGSAVYSSAFMQGQLNAGIISVMKHFPGHGGATKDTHLDPASIPFDMKHLKNNDFIPYTYALAKGLPAVMLGHLQVDAIDENHIATVSKKTIQLLQNDIGFQGLIITDSLRMGGLSKITEGESTQALEVQALSAGVDILLDPANPYETQQSIIEGIVQKNISEDTIKNSVIKILLYKLFWNLF